MGLLAPDLCARAEHRDPCCGNSETNQKNYTEFTVSKRIRIREQNPTKNKEKKKTSISFFLSFFFPSWGFSHSDESPFEKHG